MGIYESCAALLDISLTPYCLGRPDTFCQQRIGQHKSASEVYFRTNPPLGLRRGTVRAPLSPRRPISQDSRKALLLVEAFGGRAVRVSCSTRTLVFPNLRSFGGLELMSRNFRFLFAGTLPADSGGVGSRVTGSVAKISAGSKAGSGALPDLLGFPGNVCFSSIIVAASGTGSAISGISTSSTAVAPVAWGTVILVPSASGVLANNDSLKPRTVLGTAGSATSVFGTLAESCSSSQLCFFEDLACSLSRKSFSRRLTFSAASCLHHVSQVLHK